MPDATTLPSRCDAALTWPAADNAVRFIVRSAPDARGRCAFTALVHRDGRRALLQQSRGDLDAHVRQAKSEGAEVEVVEAIDARRAA